MHIFLDFDGTLADSSEGIFHAFVSACEEAGVNAPPLSEFRACIGPPIQVLARNLIPNIESDQLEILRLKFRAEYDHKHYAQVQWYAGVIEGIKYLRTWKATSLSVVTNKPTQPTNSLLGNAGISDLFQAVVGVDYRLNNKIGTVFCNKKEAIDFALMHTDCPSERAVYVGDTPSDLKASKECGVAFIAATYGFHSWLPGELEGTAGAGSFEEVVGCLRLMADGENHFVRG